MSIEDYKTILYRREDGSWVAETPAIPGCYALMPSREEAFGELGRVFDMISEEYRDNRIPRSKTRSRCSNLSVSRQS